MWQVSLELEIVQYRKLLDVELAEGRANGTFLQATQRGSPAENVTSGAKTAGLQMQAGPRKWTQWTKLWTRSENTGFNWVYIYLCMMIRVTVLGENFTSYGKFRKRFH